MYFNDETFRINKNIKMSNNDETTKRRLKRLKMKKGKSIK